MAGSVGKKLASDFGLKSFCQIIYNFKTMSTLNDDEDCGLWLKALEKPSKWTMN